MQTSSPSLLPSRRSMVAAFRRRDSSYDGVFVTAVKTTGVFCRPTCPARTPNANNVEFFRTCAEALLAGYRPCKRCRPLVARDAAPEWVTPLLDACDQNPARRWRDQDLRDLGLEPARVARWFKAQHGMTFHAFSRARRLGAAMGQIRTGRAVTASAFDAGYDSLSGFNEAFQRFAEGSPTQRKGAEVVHVTRIATPLGAMVAAATDTSLVMLEFGDRRMLPTQFKRLSRRLGCVYAPGANAVITGVERQLAEYHQRQRRSFDIALDPSGTPFQKRVWEELLRIPCGETLSYSDVARRIGQPTAVRAVAKANGDNPIAIIVPCHRVVGSDGQLVGYGGGLWRKRRLLELESGVS